MRQAQQHCTCASLLLQYVCSCSFCCSCVFPCSLLFPIIIVLFFRFSFFCFFFFVVFPSSFSTGFDFPSRRLLHASYSASKVGRSGPLFRRASVLFVCSLPVLLRDAVPTRCTVLSGDGRMSGFCGVQYDDDVIDLPTVMHQRVPMIHLAQKTV